MIDGFTLFLAGVAFVCFGFLMGTLIGAGVANNDILDECRKSNNVYECSVIAIPKSSKAIYEGTKE